MKNIAIILSGCGNRDGSELQETLSLFLAIDRKGWRYQCFAPEDDFQVVSHLTGEAVGEQRSLYAESARVARGDVRPLTEYSPADYDALMLPGGMGAARNLSTYAYDGANMQVRQDVAQAVCSTFETQKPIAAMCIAPMILAKVMGSQGVRLTLGSDGEAARVAQQLGAQHQECTPTEVCVDTRHRVATTPAYMVASHISEIFDGATHLVDAVESLM